MFPAWVRIQMHLLKAPHQDMSYNYKCSIMYGQPSKQGASQPASAPCRMDGWMDGWMNIWMDVMWTGLSPIFIVFLSHN